MNEDVLNMEIRKFLKRVGVTSQREIETAVARNQIRQAQGPQDRERPADPGDRCARRKYEMTDDIAFE
jgi:hypothetical protein